MDLHFSPNSRFMYASINDSLLQYDLLSSDIEASMIVVSKLDSGEYHGFGFSQLRPDGKI